MNLMSTRSSILFLAIAAAAGCAPDATSPDAGVTYTKDIRPIFMVKCAPCHTTDGLGMHNLGTTYADAFKPVTSLDAPAGCFKDGFDKMMPKTIGECTLPAIMEGWMPMAMMCFNTPRPAPCVTTAEQDLVAERDRDPVSTLHRVHARVVVLAVEADHSALLG
jgi:hypothetical protein